MQGGNGLAEYRRVYNRIPIEAQASLQSVQGTSMPGILKNVSIGGAGVVSSSPLEVDTQVEVALQLPAWFRDPVQSRARVVWCKKATENLWDMGLEWATKILILR